MDMTSGGGKDGFKIYVRQFKPLTVLVQDLR